MYVLRAALDGDGTERSHDDASSLSSKHSPRWPWTHLGLRRAAPSSDAAVALDTDKPRGLRNMEASNTASGPLMQLDDALQRALEHPKYRMTGEHAFKCLAALSLTKFNTECGLT